MSTLKCKKLVLFAIFPKEPPSGEKAEQQPIDNARAGAVYDHGAGDREHLCARAGDEPFCLCQDRDEGNFCPILLGFWLLKFLKKSAFFAKLL